MKVMLIGCVDRMVSVHFEWNVSVKRCLCFNVNKHCIRKSNISRGDLCALYYEVEINLNAARMQSLYRGVLRLKCIKASLY